MLSSISNPRRCRHLRWLACCAVAALGCFADSLRSDDVPHPEWRFEPSPIAGVCSLSNPPPLLWPVVSGAGVRYCVRLSQQADFPEDETLRADELRWAMFNPHRPLGEGEWFWQYGTRRRAGQDVNWSPVYRFRIVAGARNAVTPPPATWVESIPQEHPRIMVASAELHSLRKRARGTPMLQSKAAKADRLADRTVQGVEAAMPSQSGQNPFEAKNFAKWASKGYAGKLLEEVRVLTFAYLLTGNARYANAAVRRGEAIAALDPDGPTSPRVSDFADGSCMEALALVYDCCHDCLNAEQKSRLQAAMIARAGRWFSRQMNHLEARVFSAHAWQHILAQATYVAVALRGHEPEADQWLTYVYELWQARVPLLGGDDGGWANGINYFGTNFKTLLEMPLLFERYTGKTDFFSHPWFRNAIYYQLYCWPPDSSSDGFGDGAEREGPPPLSRAMFLYALGRRFQDETAIWYAQRVAGDRDLDSLLTPACWIDRVLHGDTEIPAATAPLELPQAREFRDAGIVAMHTDLASPSKNCMLAFRSSPYGSFNHMHADQNSFHLLVGGRRLFCGSGYYIGYGDPHFNGWYTQTRAQNSVLIDGRGQVRGAGGYGQIVRFLHGREISYCCGDASHAYGDAGLTRFRRHLVFLRPGIAVVYDDLAADHAARWSWLLHSPQQVSMEAKQRLRTRDEAGSAHVDLFGSEELRLIIGDQFDPPAVNWRNKTSGGRVLEYPDQWHVTAEPVDPALAARVLAVIQFGGPKKSFSPATPDRQADGSFRVDSWRITPVLDPAQPAGLRIERSGGQAALSVAGGALTVGGTRYECGPAESLLVESRDGIVERCSDKSPPP